MVNRERDVIKILEHEFRQKQSLSYEAKLIHAEIKAREFYDRMDGDVYCSVGGIDSLTLLLFLRKVINPNIPGVTISAIEMKSVQEVHKMIPNMVFLQPLKTKVQVIREIGYPIISKESAKKVRVLQNPTQRNAIFRHACVTGRSQLRPDVVSSTTKLPEKWLRLFAGLENEKYSKNYKCAPFKVSEQCCYWMKERPLVLYQKHSKSHPYIGLTASEKGMRETALIKNGCNYYGKNMSRSCPFAIFSQSDVLRLALELNVPLPEAYGEIKQREDGSFYTTKAKRTGCSMCGFGVHLEKRPHRFDHLRAENEKEWHFWMYDMGWGQVLDYIGVKWEDKIDV